MQSFREIFKSTERRTSLTVVMALLVMMHLLVVGGLCLVYHSHPVLIGLSVLAYGYGLRHSVDADHLAAIDNVTRKLMQEGKTPTTVGFFFALGHSTVVIIVSAIIAMTSGIVLARMPEMKVVGGLIGTGASSIFLILIGVINLFFLLDTINVWKKLKADDEPAYASIDNIQTAGFLNRLLSPLMRLIADSRQMYWVGLIFGLGFDTASEVALLSLTGSSSSASVPFWAVMILPLAFTAGMSLIDTLDGVIMLGAYGWAFLKPMRKLQYNIVITATSVFLAFVIGGFEAVQLINQHYGSSASMAFLADKVQFANWGFYIIGVFVICWIVSILLDKFNNSKRIFE